MSTRMKHKPKIISLKRRLVITVSLFLLITLMFALRSFPGLVEQYYSLRAYPLIRTCLQFIFNSFPFSIGDIVYVLFITGLLTGFILILRLLLKKRFKEGLVLSLGLILNFEIAFMIFYLFWGLNYFRVPASERLGLTNRDYNAAELLSVSDMLVDSVNSSRAALSTNETQSSAAFEYQASIRAVRQLSATSQAFRTSYPMVKPSLLSPLLNYIGTAGYYNPFTGESHINNQMPVFLRPFVACHEMAHQTGYGREDEANFVGFLSGIASDNKLLKYSSYYLATQEFLAEVWKTDTIAFKAMKNRISEPVLADFQKERQYWTKYQGNAAKLSSIFYDNYLKVNKQPEGLKTYNRMIRLTMAYYRKKGLIKAPVPLMP